MVMYGLLMLIELEFVKESIFIVKSMSGDERSKHIFLSPQIFLLFCSGRVSPELFLALWPLQVHEIFTVMTLLLILPNTQQHFILLAVF